MSATRHAVVRGPSFTGLGKRPDFTPAHHVDLLTGMGPAGAKMLDIRRKPELVPGMESTSLCEMECWHRGLNRWSISRK